MLEVKNLSAWYGHSHILQNISLKVQKGEIVTLIGRNGAGKSTTLKILTGIIPDFEGDVHVLGMDVRKDAMEVKSKGQRWVAFTKIISFD